MASRIVIDNIEAGYGSVRVLHGVSVTVEPGETVVLLGTNGNGKSTLINCIMGIVQPTSGAIYLEGDEGRVDLVGKAPEEIVNLGIALVPEGRRLFPRLTVEENLALGAFRAAARKEINENLAFCYEAFPALMERRGQLAGSMSGGEQQMLAIGRALIAFLQFLDLRDPRQPHDREDQGIAGTLPAHRDDGRAELQSGDQDRRPRLHHRPWRDRLPRDQCPRPQGKRSGQAVLSGSLNGPPIEPASDIWFTCFRNSTRMDKGPTA